MARLAVLLGSGTALAFAIGIWGYAIVSFFLMRAHTARRELGLTLRELVRETFLTALTQPFLPLYYLIGDRMEPLFQRQKMPAPGDPPRIPIVFVHGYMQNRVGFVGLARALARAGLGPLYGINYPWWSSIPANAKRLERYVERVCRETKSAAVDVVCHSMGGLVAMEMMRSTAKREDLHVRRCVTIATPHAGVAWRGPMLGFGATNLRRGSKLLAAHAGYSVAVPTLSVFSSHDNVVHPKETSSLVKRGGEDFEVAGPSHFSILFSPLVAEQVAAFLSKAERAPEIEEMSEEIASLPERPYSARRMDSAAEASIFPLTSPATGKELSAVEATAPEDVAAVVKRAREAQVTWAALTPERRARDVAKLKKKILQHAEELGRLIHDETGKPEVEGLLGEVLASADVVAYWADIAPEELEPLEADLDGLAYPKKRAWIHREARGVIALVMPWNFPFALPLRTIVPALLAGNAVVLKPSEITPRTGAKLVALFEGIVPDGLVSVVQGGGDVGGALISADVDFVVFTGSTATGKKVAHACADRLLPCVVELGGKDAAIVLADADLDRAANGILWGAMMNAGQNCGAVERVYAVKSIADQLSAKITAAAKELRFGADFGPLTTKMQLETVQRHIEAAKAANAAILTGGKAIASDTSKTGWEPTVVTIDADDNPLIADETFGPVVPITAVADVEEAIKRANASRYGLTASLWTADVRAAEKLAHRLKAGVVTINNHSFTGAIPSMPWGGVGESGWGFTGSPLALEHLTRPRVIVIDRNRAARETWWYPYTPTLKRLALTFALLRGGATSIGGRIGAFFALLGILPKRMGELKSGKPRD